MTRYDIAVAYRVYPGVSKTPLVHADDKLALARLCLASFKEALGDVRAKVYAILDSCPPEYRALFEEYFAKEDLDVIELDHAGNQGSFASQIDVLLGQDDAEAVYFAEDDYLYLPNTFQEMLSLLKNGAGRLPADFVTPYDHSDYYTLLLHRHRHKEYKGVHRAWRTVNSTCLTFLTTKRTLTQARAVFATYAHKKNLDASIWLSLTKYHVFNPFFVLRAFFAEPAAFKIVLKAWIYNAPRLFGRRYLLWAPKPTLATHTDDRFLAPGVDWAAEVKRIEGIPGAPR